MEAFLRQIEELGAGAYDWILEPENVGVFNGLAGLLAKDMVAVTRAMRKLLEASRTKKSGAAKKTRVTKKEIEELKAMLKDRAGELADAALPPSISPPPPAGLKVLLLPGYHASCLPFVALEQFGRNAHLQLLDEEQRLYLRADKLGRVVDDGDAGLVFKELKAVGIRQWLDSNYDVGKWVNNKNPWWKQENPSSDHADQVLAAAQHDPTLARVLKGIVSFPAFVPEGGELALLKFGWNPNHGIACAWPGLPDDWAPRELDPENPVDRAYVTECLADLLVDFPLKEAVDITNMIALLLTPMIRNAVGGNVPMYAILAPQARTGKTKLASDLFGILFLGKPVPTTPWSPNEEEVEKRLFGLLVSAAPLVVIDNVNSYFKSPSLAMLITTRQYASRVLGSTNNTVIDNRMTIVWTANNPVGHQELLKRSVPIRLEPTSEKPERRNDFKHPELDAFVHGKRAEILSLLAGMVNAWIGAGSKPGKEMLGGFESYSRVLSGVLELWGFEGWASNLDVWVEEGAEDEQDAGRLVTVWVHDCSSLQRAFNPTLWRREFKATGLLELCRDADLFAGFLDQYKSDGGKAQGMGRIMRQFLVGRQFDGYRVRSRQAQHTTIYYLEKELEPTVGPRNGEVEGVGREVSPEPPQPNPFVGLD